MEQESGQELQRARGRQGRRLMRRFRRLLGGSKAAREAGLSLTAPARLTGRRTDPSLVPEALFEATPSFPVLRDPTPVEARHVGLDPEEPILGVEVGGEVRIYPISILRRHHIVNDLAGGQPIVVTFCPKCYSGVAFDARLDDRRLVFDVYGMYHGGMVMSDVESGSVFDRFTGMAVVGPLAGRSLEMIPLHMAKSGEWLQRFPQSLTPDPRLTAPRVLLLPGQSRHGTEVTASVAHRDERVPDRQLVLGVRLGGSARAYVLDQDQPGPQLKQDDLAGIPIVLLAAPGSWPLAYDRRVAGGIVDLRLEDQRLVDRDGTIWSPEGVGVDGPLFGERLVFVPSMLTEWYSWASANPGSEVSAV